MRLKPHQICRELRERGMSDVDIAQRTNSSPATISRVRGGQTKRPRYDLVRALEDLLRDLETEETRKDAEAA